MNAVTAQEPQLPEGYVPFDTRPHGAHMKLLNSVPAGSRVIDAGCSTGYLAEQLAGRGCTVTGLELDPVAAQLAERWCDQVIVGDLDAMELPLPAGEFDVALCGDILEHLRDPRGLLEHLRPLLRPGGLLVVSTPNIANWSIRASLLLGRFDYTYRGILDRTHTHLFTRKTLLQCMRDAGYAPVSVDYTVPLPHALRSDERERLAHRVGSMRPTLFAYQWVISATPGLTAGRG